MYIIAACLLLIIWCLPRYFKWRKEFLNLLERLPGPRRYPILGTTHIFLGIPKDELFAFYEGYIKRWPSVFRTWNGGFPEVHIRKAEHLEIIMNNSIHTNKGTLYNYILPWLGEGLLISKGTKWIEHRKLITPTFHFKILENFLRTFEEKTKLLLKQLEEKSDGDFFNIYPYISHCTLDIICETAMGVNVNAMQNNDSKYVQSIFRICELITWRYVRPYCYPDLIYCMFPQGREFHRLKRFLHNFSYKVISERKQIFHRNKAKPGVGNGYKSTRLSFLDLLLEVSYNNPNLSDEAIREEVDTFMFEGHDTITAAIYWAIFLLGNNPDVQDKVFSELQEVLDEKPVPTKIEELNEMKYLECVIKEALRLFPSVPLIIRTLGQDIYLDGYRIPKGVEAVLHIYQVHRDSEYFPEPEKFDPDRFLPQNTVGRHPYAYIPFSAGPRNCIGQKFAMYEEKTILATIIKKFRIESLDTPENIKQVTGLILRPGGAINVKLVKRK